MNVLQEIDTILEEFNTVRKNRAYGTDFLKCLEHEDVIFNKLCDLSDKQPEAVVPGRVIRFQVADGYAHYVITKVGKRDVVVKHVDIGDGYQYSGCYLDKNKNCVIPRPVVEKVLAWEIGMSKLFGKK
jgi:hypothetical protein